MNERLKKFFPLIFPVMIAAMFALDGCGDVSFSMSTSDSLPTSMPLVDCSTISYPDTLEMKDGHFPDLTRRKDFFGGYPEDGPYPNFGDVEKVLGETYNPTGLPCVFTLTNTNGLTFDVEINSINNNSNR